MGGVDVDLGPQRTIGNQAILRVIGSQRSAARATDSRGQLADRLAGQSMHGVNRPSSAQLSAGSSVWRDVRGAEHDSRPVERDGRAAAAGSSTDVDIRRPKIASSGAPHREPLVPAQEESAATLSSVRIHDVRSHDIGREIRATATAASDIASRFDIDARRRSSHREHVPPGNVHAVRQGSARVTRPKRVDGDRGDRWISRAPRADIQRFDWLTSTPLATLGTWLYSPSWEGLKDMYDPRRWRLNPLNMVAGVKNKAEEEAGGNYHSSSKHGAHNTAANVMARVGGLPGNMADKYTGGNVNAANTTSRFNSEAWERFSWNKAKALFEADIGVPVTWIPGPIAANARSTWTVCLQHANRDVGVSGSVAAALASVDGVRVAVNYELAGGGPGVRAYNGQMFPTAVAVPAAGHVRAGPPFHHPAGGGMNGTVQAIPQSFLDYFRF